MTKLRTTVPNLEDNEGIISSTLDDNPENDRSLNLQEEIHYERKISDHVIDSENESLNWCPLGYQRYLYDIDIEYSPGGHNSHPAGNKQIFKLKCLPYMVKRKEKYNFEKSSFSGSLVDSDQTNLDEDFDPRVDSDYVDVTKETCAFLGNFEYVPIDKIKRPRVVLELISAKLSHINASNTASNLNRASLVALNEQISIDSTTSEDNGLSLQSSYHQQRNNQNSNSLANSESIAMTTSSKRFVIYTLLIKITPGIDKHPSLIERRFSDFLTLYQGLKNQNSLANLINKHVTFPKKILMGNFSLSNISDRSIEFNRLVSLCMSTKKLLWSIPFISFLLDKELSEGHRLSLCGDPDDVQALIETSYYILKKLYLRKILINDCHSSSNSFDSNVDTSNDNINSYSPLPLPKNRNNNNNQTAIIHSSSNETISAESNKSNYLNDQSTTSTDCGSSPNESISDNSDELNGSPLTNKLNLAPLNQRILVTFCMLFIVYQRNENYQEFKHVVQDFSQLISSNDYVGTLISTRHYSTLRACLLFLMNVNHIDVVDDNRRSWLKQKLEDIDGLHADIDESLSISIQSSTTIETNSVSSGSGKTKKRVSFVDTNTNTNTGSNTSLSAFRITKGDLTSLIRDKNFCSFQDKR